MKTLYKKKIPFFLVYDFIFTVLFLVFFRNQSMQVFFSVSFWVGVLITLGEISWRTLIKYKFLERTTYKFWGTFCLFWIIENLFVFTQYKKEKFIYFWDSQNYWTLSINFSDQYFTNFVHAVKILYHSVLYNDYNFVPTLLLSLPMKLFGHSYLTYAMTINNLYMLPTLLLIILLIRKILIDIHLDTNLTLFFAICVPFLFTPFTIPLMRGYLDSAGLFFIALIIIFIYSSKFIQRDFSRDLTFGMLIVFLLMTRRWYAYYIVSLLISFGFTSIIKIFIFDKNNKKRNLISFFLHMLIVGLECLFVLGGFFKDFLIKSVSGNYSLAYSAWQKGSLLNKVMDSVNYIGLVMCIFAIIGITFLLYKREKRFFACNLLLQVAIAYYLFNNVQSFGIHHYYLVVVPLCILLTVGVVRVMSIRFITINKIIASFVFILLCWNFVQTYYPIFAAERNTNFLSKATAYPRVRNDIQQIRKIVSYLNKLTENNGKKIYVLSSSANLNDGIISRAYAPEILYAVPSMLKTNHVDLRDGFPNQFFHADYVVIADPIQYHLRPENQRVIGMLANSILNGTFQNFKLLRTYHIENGVAVRIYEKNEHFHQADLNKIRAYFNKYYHNEKGFTNINN